ncbi:MAG: hypothetical protein RIS35_1580 [Pseudomonadota bacterium]|jgi:hypothetical protein
MRILVTIPHFFKAEAESRHSSTDARRKANRRRAIEDILIGWRSHFDTTLTLQIDRRAYERTGGVASTLDLVVVVNRDDHLLDDALLRLTSTTVVRVDEENPRMLPFATHRVMSERRGAYDWFVYSEDDLLVRDPSFFDKQSAFQAQFGWRRVLQPNRFELNRVGPQFKIFVDGNLRPGVTAPYHQALPDEEFLHQTMGSARITHRRALNPHSGFFCLGADQLDHWIRQPHFGDRDSRFISPLESAATLGILKTFALYKPFGAHSGFLEIEHLDDRFSPKAPAKANPATNGRA